VLQAVVFDFYNTLAESPESRPHWEQILGELGYSVPAEVRDTWWNDGIDGTEHDEHSVSRDHYVAWQHMRVRNALGRCGVPDDVHDEVVTRMRAATPSGGMDAYDEVGDVLAELRARGLTLAICSNWDWDLHEALAAAGLTGVVDVVVSSAWVGARKPHPRIYAHTLAALEIDPEHVLFVGDTWSCDVDGPLAAGMQSIYLRRDHLGDDLTAPGPDDRARPGVTPARDLHAVLEVVDARGALDATQR